MYSIDGVPLANPAKGWRFKRQSEPWVSRSHNRLDFNATNRDGSVSVRGNVGTPTVTLVARAPGSTVEALRQLMNRGKTLTLTSDPSAVLAVESMTVSHVTITPAGGGIHEITGVFRAPSVWWRDAATTDYSVGLPQATNASANATILNGSTAAVRDALIVATGEFTNLRIAGSGGSWIEWDGTIWDGSWLRIDTATGRAWTGTSLDKWGDTSSEVTNGINTGAYPYFLELAPGSTAPGCTATFSWATVGPKGAVVTVRAANAYDR